MPSRLPEEAELIPYTSGFLPGRRWLVLAPHPDDETLGLGGTLARAWSDAVFLRLSIPPRICTPCTTPVIPMYSRCATG